MSWSGFLEKYNKALSYYNFVEYVVPSGLFILIIGIDLRVVLEVNLIPENFSLQQPFIIVGALMLVGWFMYVSRFYHLFPYYQKIKKNALSRIGNLFEDIDDELKAKPEKVGKYAFRIYWRNVEGEEKKESLRLHVNWVFLVHLCNTLMLSFVFACLLYLYRLFFEGTAVPETFQRDVVLLIGAHILLYFTFRTVAIKNLKRSNFNVFDNINNKKGFIAQKQHRSQLLHI